MSIWLTQLYTTSLLNPPGAPLALEAAVPLSLWSTLMIFFVTIRLSQTVHAQGLGFTKTLFAYVWAASLDHASHLATHWYQHKGCVVEQASTTPAINQELRSFAMPESIINIPDSMLHQEYERRGWPESLREPARRVPASLMH